MKSRAVELHGQILEACFPDLSVPGIVALSGLVKMLKMLKAADKNFPNAKVSSNQYTALPYSLSSLFCSSQTT